MQKLLYGLIGLFSISGVLLSEGLSIIPSPQDVTFREGNLEISDSSEWCITLSGEELQGQPAVNYLVQTIYEQWKCPVSIVNPPMGKATGLYFIGLSSSGFLSSLPEYQFSKNMLDEGYILDISAGGIVIVASSSKGLFYGAMSLIQMIRASESRRLPHVLIKDYPALAWRGISDDISRGQVSTMDNFKKIIRFLAEYKYNIYMPYLEDVIQLESYPDIGSGRGALSRCDIVEIQEYAAQHHIRVIPIFQTLGHYENILNMPDYMKYAEYPGAASLNSNAKSTYRFLFRMLDEIIPQFNSEYFHIGADESWDVGRGATRQLTDEIGVAAVHAKHYHKVYEKVRSFDKKVLMYGDIILRHPEILDLIPHDIIIVDWHYWPNDVYSSVAKFKKAGFDVLVSPGIHNWNNPIPNYTSALINIANINRQGFRENALGTILSNWGDYGGPNFRELNYPGYAVGAESAWNPEHAVNETLTARFFKQYCGISDSRVDALMFHLSEIAYHTNFKEIWSAPFHLKQENSSKRLVRSKRLTDNSKIALRLIEDLRKKAVRNEDIFDYLALGAKQGKFMGDKIYFSRSIERLSATRKCDSAECNKLVGDCGGFIETVIGLEKEYRELWLRTNKPDNLSRIINLFRHQCAYFEDARKYLVDYNLNIPGDLSSSWISSAKEIKDLKQQTVYLRKEFTIDDQEPIVSADLQLIANSNAQIYVNGKNVGTVQATKSLSLLVENQRVGWWRIEDLLKGGKNTIALEVQSYRKEWPGAANIYLRLTGNAGNLLIIESDSSWVCTHSPKRGWKSGSVSENNWESVTVWQEAPWQISPPLFDFGFCSRIEF